MTCHFRSDFNIDDLFSLDSRIISGWSLYNWELLWKLFYFWFHVNHMCSDSNPHSSRQTKWSRNPCLCLRLCKDTKFLFHRLFQLWSQLFVEAPLCFKLTWVQLVRSKQVSDRQSRTTSSMSLHSVPKIQRRVQCPSEILVPHCACVN